MLYLRQWSTVKQQTNLLCKDKYSQTAVLHNQIHILILFRTINDTLKISLSVDHQIPSNHKFVSYSVGDAY